MPGERVQRQIDCLLDKAEAAVSSLDWEAVRETVSAVLAIDGQNEDARAFLSMAEAAGGRGVTLATAALAEREPAATPTVSQPATRTSFSPGRHEVRRYRGGATGWRIRRLA